MKLFWLSFCDNDLPKGKKFLGAVITEAESPGIAMEKTHRLGINPGGEIAFSEIKNINPEHLDKLMGAEELKEKGY